VRRSLRARLVAAAAGSILVAVAIFGIAAAAITDHRLHATLDSALRQRARDVARLASSAPAVLTAPGALESPAGGRQVVVEVFDARNRILARSVALGARLLPRDPAIERARRSGRAGFADIRLDGGPARLYAAPIALTGGSAAGGVVAVASQTADIESTTRHLRVLLLLSGLGAALLAAVLAALLTGRGLLPLRRLSAGAREIQRTADVSRRVPAAAVEDDEVGELTTVLNEMLAALERARDAERRFLADASHELRTPVSALLGNAEYIANHGADAEALADLRDDAARLARLVDDLLVLERAEAGTGRDDAIDLAELVRLEADGRERVVVGELAPLSAHGDGPALRRAVANLLDNALVHGPADGRVHVDLRRAGDRAQLVVRDEGPGPPPDARDRIFERFYRGAASAERPGSGLGLPIAAMIARRHGGTITVEGSAFTLELPLTSAQP
jgi:two-component system OmpR family sensor kinase